MQFYHLSLLLTVLLANLIATNLASQRSHPELGNDDVNFAWNTKQAEQSEELKPYRGLTFSDSGIVTKDDRLNQLNPQSKYRILLHTIIGGNSHLKGISEILQQLSVQHHTINYVSTDDNLKYIRNHPDYFNFTLTSLGPSVTDEHEFRTLMETTFHTKTNNKDGMITISENLSVLFDRSYRLTFTKLEAEIVAFRPDLVVCDFLALACQDLARKYSIPTVTSFQTIDLFEITSSIYLTKSLSLNSPLTTLNLSFAARAYMFLIEYPKMAYYGLKINKVIEKSRLEFGIVTTAKPFGDLRDTLGVANSFVGFESSQFFQPNLKLVGPISSDIVERKDEDLIRFLNGKSRLVYVSFGTNVILAQFDILNLLASLNLALQTKVIDGVIWSLGRTELADIINLNSNSSNTTNSDIGIDTNTANGNTVDLSAKYYFKKYLPQKFILKQPNVKLIIHHGGIETCFESILEKKFQFILPFMGDQFRNARKLADLKVAYSFDRYTLTSDLLYTKVQALITDNNNNKNDLDYIYKLAKFNQLDNSKLKSSQLLLQYIELSKLCRNFQFDKCNIQQKTNLIQPNCELKHLIPHSQLMSPIQAYQLDILFVVLSLIVLWLGTLGLVVKGLIAKIINQVYTNNNKPNSTNQDLNFEKRNKVKVN